MKELPSALIPCGECNEENVQVAQQQKALKSAISVQKASSLFFFFSFLFEFFLFFLRSFFFQRMRSEG